MARTDTAEARRGGKGISTFILTPDLPGFSVGKKEDKLGLRATPTVQLNFDEMRVPGDRLLGEEGQGLHLRDAVARPRSAWHRGAGDRHCDARRSRPARVYAAERKQFGQPIEDFQAIQFKLADMATRITAARALLYATAGQGCAARPITQFSAMASCSPAKPPCGSPPRPSRFLVATAM